MINTDRRMVWIKLQRGYDARGFSLLFAERVLNLQRSEQ
jgi:hypothetical protein